MRCKEHLSDSGSTIGVCATCLRQKLTTLNSSFDHGNHNYDHDHDFDSNLKQPQPLVLPRSVSPYIRRRKSDHQTEEPVIGRFYSTPQVEKKHRSKSGAKFGLISKLFRSKSSVAATSTASSELGKDELTRWRNRGMSPESEFESPSIAARIQPSPDRVQVQIQPSPGRVKPSQGSFASNIAFCLSPLVRASPSGASPSFSGEITGGGGKAGNFSKNGGVSGKKPQLSEAASYCGNRSRKIADFGRVNRNR